MLETGRKGSVTKNYNDYNSEWLYGNRCIHELIHHKYFSVVEQVCVLSSWDGIWRTPVPIPDILLPYSLNHYSQWPLLKLLQNDQLRLRHQWVQEQAVIWIFIVFIAMRNTLRIWSTHNAIHR